MPANQTVKAATELLAIKKIRKKKNKINIICSTKIRSRKGLKARTLRIEPTLPQLSSRTRCDWIFSAKNLIKADFTLRKWLCKPILCALISLHTNFDRYFTSLPTTRFMSLLCYLSSQMNSLILFFPNAY